MPTDACVLQKGIYDTLTACGPYGNNQVSGCDYRIIEQNSGCAIVFHYGPEETSNPNTFSGGGTTTTEFSTMQWTCEEYVQFTGDSRKFLADIRKARDDFKRTLRKDKKLQSTACFSWISKVMYNIDEGYEMGGKDWGVIRYVISVHDM